MIRHEAREYGTAAEIAQRLTRPGGDKVTQHMVRNWSQRDGLARHRDGRTVYYALDQAAVIERAKRKSKEETGRGRPRRLDATLVLAA